MSESRRYCAVFYGCFAYAFFNAMTCWAVNLEFGAGTPEEDFLELTAANAQSHQDGLATASAIDGATISETGFAVSGSFAGIESRDLEAYTQAQASLFSDIMYDSDTTIIALLTPGIEAPPEYAPFVFSQGAFAFSTDSGGAVGSSLHALSVVDFEFSDIIEEIIDEETGISDYLLHLSPADCIIDVLPSAGEKPGRPTRISIVTAVEGLLAAEGIGGIGDASWLVVVNENTTLLSGSVTAVEQPDPLIFAAAASHSFVVPLGGSFKLRFLWELSVTASDESAAAGEFTAAAIVISAATIPEPSSWLVLVCGLMTVPRRRRR